jgi:hypothetical protein
MMLVRIRILPPRAIWASVTTHPARCRYNSSQSKPPTIEPKSTSTTPGSPPDGIPTFQDLGLPTPPPSAPVFSREKLTDEEIRRTGGNLAKLIRDSIRVGLKRMLSDPLPEFSRLPGWLSLSCIFRYTEPGIICLGCSL